MENQKFLDSLAAAYYEGAPLVSDVEWDHLAEIYQYNAVGYRPTDGIPHTFPMFSLQKCYDITKAPFSPLHGVVVTPKLDGAAVSLLYVNGELVLGLTRGDGVLGRDITEKMKLLAPETLRNSGGILQVTGEVVAPKTIPNARNYASGALNLKDIEEFRQRELQFIAYDIQSQKRIWTTWEAKMVALGSDYFSVVNDAYTDWTALYPTDGSVFRINNELDFQKAGHTSNHPKGAFALKEQQEGVRTKLNDVVWQVGKSGAVSPVAILEPVKVGDAVVSRATLHNIEYIDSLGLEIGCDVEIIRSGEIIPRVVRRVC
jgi:NAD-dependent DNA ligase